MTLRRWSRDTVRILLVFAIASCADHTLPTMPDETVGPAFLIDDGANGPMTVPGFFWLPPTVPAPPPSFGGRFDPSLLTLAPRIDICNASGNPQRPADCTILKSLTTASSPPERITLDLRGENYNANWLSTGDPAFAVSQTYRAFASVGTRVLGLLDLKAVAKQKDIKDVPAGFVGLVVGHPFLFKFRVETGIPGAIVVTPPTAMIFDANTTPTPTQNFDATVTDLYNVALPGINVDWTSSNPSLATVVSPTGPTNGAGKTTTTATAAGTVVTNTDVTITAKAQGVTGTAKLTIKPSLVAPTAVDDSYGPVGTFPFIVTPGGTPDGLLGNDSGNPAPTVASFGGGSLPGNAGTNAAGTTVSFGTGGSLKVDANGGFTFSPSAGFTGDFTFDYRITNGVAPDDDGMVTIQVEAMPMVQSTSPANGDTNQAIDTNIIVTFSEPVSVGSSWFQIVCGTSGTRDVGDTSVSGGPTTFTIDPTADFAQGESCTTTIKKDQVTDLDGTPDNMAADFVFTFTTDVAPTVVSTNPANGDIDVLPTDVISIDFSESVNATVGSFSIQCPVSSPKSFSLSPSPASSFTLTPDANLPAGTTCTVTVFAAGITDVDTGDPPDNMAADFTFSFTLPVVANDDTYPETGIGNVSVDSDNVSGGPFSVLDNDLAQNPLTITAYDAVSMNGGNVSMDADGTFAYNPPAGFTGTDTFEYTISDGVTSDNGTVSMTVTNMVWFIDNTASAPGANAGRLSNPFNSLADFDAANGAGGANDPAAGDNIFIYTGSGDYTGGVTLENSQKLIGQGAGASISAITGITPPASSAALPSTGGTRPVIVNSGGDGIVLASNNTIRGLNIGNTSGVGLKGSGFGSASVADASITGSGAGIELSSGSGSFSFSQVTSTSGARGISLTSVSGSFSVLPGPSSLSGHSSHAVRIQSSSATFAYPGSITNSAEGIMLSANSGTFTFSGPMNLNTGTNPAFTATGGGTVNVTGTANTISTTTGTALNVTNTTIGAAGLTFRSISANGGANGIVLDNTGTSGGLTVTGTGTPASGGTIRNMTGGDGATSGIGIRLNQTRNVSLSRMQLNDFSNFAIRGTNVTNFSMTNSTISGANGTSAAVDEGSVSFDNLLGTATFTFVNISGGLEDNIVVTNDTGTLDMTVMSSILGLNSTSLGNDAILVESQGSATLNLTVKESTFTGARGDMVQCNALGTSTMDCTLQDNDFSNTHTNIVSGGGGITISGGSASSNINVTYDVSGTTAGSQIFKGARGNAITVNFVNGAGTAVGTIRNNEIGTSSSAGSGSKEGAGISVGASKNVAHTVTIDDNTIREIKGFAGIDVVGNMDVTMNVTITDNTITLSSDPTDNFAFAAAYLLVGGAGTEIGTLCSDIRNNSFSASGAPFSGNAVAFDQISTSAKHNLPAYTGSAQGESATPVGTASADISAYLLGRSNTMVNGPSPTFPGGVDAGVVHGVTGTGTGCS